MNYFTDSASKCPRVVPGLMRTRCPKQRRQALQTVIIHQYLSALKLILKSDLAQHIELPP